MAERRLGVIMNGVTGRMGYRQHLVRSVLAIREQGGVDVHDGGREGIQQDRGDDPHEARQDHQLDPVLVEGFDQCFVVGFPAGKDPVVDVQGRDAMPSGATNGWLAPTCPASCRRR